MRPTRWREHLLWLYQPLLFGLVGLLNTAIDLFAFLILVRWHVPPLVANVLSFSLGSTNSYVWNSRLTFRGAWPVQRSWQRICRFAIVTLGGLCLSQSALWAALQLMFSPASAKVIAIVMTFAVGFVLNKSFVFASR